MRETSFDNTVELSVTDRQSNRLDLCIMMSLSSTMEDWADRVKNSIEAIVKSVKDANQGLEIKVGLVGYRDVQSPNRIEKVYFT